MSHPSLTEEADRLYALPLAEFTPARDALVKEHRSSDRPFADSLKALRKPSLAAWVVNLLVRRDAAQVDQILAVGAALRQAQADLSGDDLRALTRQRRQLTAAVTQRARALSLEHGQRVTEAVAEQVEATLTAAMIDPGAASAVRTGLLVAPLTATGVDHLDLTAYVALPELADFTPSPLEEPVRPRPDLHVVPDPDAVAKRIARAEEALEDAEAAVDEATEAVAGARSEVDDLEARSLQLQSEIAELRRQLAEHEAEQEETDEELANATDTLRDAQTDLAAAESARGRAREALSRLTQ